MKKLKHYTESIYYEIEKTGRLMKLAAANMFTKLKLNMGLDEYGALDVISCNEGICQRDLAKTILKDRANTGRIVNSLEEKGFITRSADTKNNRPVRKLKVTGKGLEELSRVNEHIKDYMQSLRAVFSEEETESLHNALKIFSANVEKLIELKI